MFFSASTQTRNCSPRKSQVNVKLTSYTSFLSKILFDISQLLPLVTQCWHNRNMSGVATVAEIEAMHLPNDVDCPFPRLSYCNCWMSNLPATESPVLSPQYSYHPTRRPVRHLVACWPHWTPSILEAAASRMTGINPYSRCMFAFRACKASNKTTHCLGVYRMFDSLAWGPI